MISIQSIGRVGRELEKGDPGETKMATNLDNTDRLSVGPQEAAEQDFLEHLRANGVRLGRQGLNRPRIIGRQRPMWLAFIVRTLRKLHVLDD